jgi:hypothetical protein
LGKFCRVLPWKMLVYYTIWSILRPFGTVCGQLTYFMVIRYFFLILCMPHQEKSGNPGLKRDAQTHTHNECINLPASFSTSKLFPPKFGNMQSLKRSGCSATYFNRTTFTLIVFPTTYIFLFTPVSNDHIYIHTLFMYVNNQNKIKVIKDSFHTWDQVPKAGN